MSAFVGSSKIVGQVRKVCHKKNITGQILPEGNIVRQNCLPLKSYRKRSTFLVYLVWLVSCDDPHD